MPMKCVPSWYLFLCDRIYEVIARLFWICLNYAKYNSFEMLSNAGSEFNVISNTLLALDLECVSADS